LPFAAIEELNLEERQRGEFIHRVLYFVDELGESLESELEGIIRRVNDELKTDYPASDMKKRLLEFLSHRDIRPYFEATSGRVIKKEQDFSDPGGNLFRMDRVVIDEDRISVIDYKTGTDKEAEKEYVSQLKNYIWILREIYPGKNIEGVIAYVDLKEITLIH
jgi:ATP-dependent exoDNAse (exonuclease V) beta subunit